MHKPLIRLNDYDDLDGTAKEKEARKLQEDAEAMLALFEKFSLQTIQLDLARAFIEREQRRRAIILAVWGF